MRIRTDLSMPDRIAPALTRTADVLAQDAHTVDPPMTYSECVDMAADCYLELHGGDREAVRAFRGLPESDQAAAIRRAKRR